MANELKGTISPRGSVKGTIGVLEKIQGRSAYEVAVVNGFSGTEEEWLLSLVGEKGEQGERGIQATYDEDTKTLYITGGGTGGSGGGSGEPGVGIEKIWQAETSNVSDGINKIAIRTTDGTVTAFTIRNGSQGVRGATGATGATGARGEKGDKGATGVGISSASYANGVLTFTKTDGSKTSVTMPVSSTPENCYTKNEVDAMFGSYIDYVANLIGGDA